MGQQKGSSTCGLGVVHCAHRTDVEAKQATSNDGDGGDAIDVPNLIHVVSSPEQTKSCRVQLWDWRQQAYIDSADWLAGRPRGRLGASNPKRQNVVPPAGDSRSPAAELPSPLAGGCGHGTGLCGCPGVVGTRWSGQRACGEKQAIGRRTRPVHVVLGGFFISGTVGGAGCKRPSSQWIAKLLLAAVLQLSTRRCRYHLHRHRRFPRRCLLRLSIAAPLHRCEAAVLIRRVRHGAMHTPSAADVDPFFPPQAPCNTTTSR